MAYLNDYQYYENDGNAPADANWGSYQFVSLAEIVNNFLLMYDDIKYYFTLNVLFKN